MTTVEKRVRDYLEANGYYYTDETVSAAANYIEHKNMDAPDNEKCYTVADWAIDTKQNNPEFFIRFDECCRAGAIELKNQRRKCIDQTGHEPTLDDYLLETESDTFKEATHGIVTLADVIGFMLRYSIFKV